MRIGDIGTPVQLLGLALAHAYETYPREACGIWAGRKGRAFHNPDHIFYTENVSPDPERHFKVERRKQLELWSLLDSRELDPVVAYHSHCIGQAVPSQDDVDSHDQTMIMLIIGLAVPFQPTMSMYMVNDGNYVAIDFPY